MLSALRRVAFFVSGVTSIARISMDQKMIKRSETKRQHFFAGTPKGINEITPTLSLKVVKWQSSWWITPSTAKLDTF
jgi:hypothetical protein